MAVSRARPEPLYYQVRDEIRRRISTGQWAVGQKVPSERHLAELLDVSRITIRHAVRLAAEEGLLEQRPGVGTFVAEPGRLNQDLSEVRSFEQTLADMGHVATTAILRSGLSASDLAVSAILQLDPASPTYNLRLLGSGGPSPVALYDSYFSPTVGQQMAEVAREMHERGHPFSTLDLYRHGSTERTPTMLSQTIEALAAGDELAEPLALPVGGPVLAIETVMADDEGPLEFRRAYYRGDRYKFGIRRPLNGLRSSR